MDINELLFMGVNKYGQAGIGEKYHNKTFSLPKSFAFPTFIKQISCGSHHSALLTIDGNIYTMGSNIHGALGSNPALNYSFVPTLVEGLSDVTKIDCGPFHMCAIANGDLYSWGKGIDGQLGHGNTKNISKPLKVDGFDGGVEQVSCGTNHTLVLVGNRGDASRSGFAFGNGIYGQLGSGQNKNSYFPTKIKLQNIESIAAGENHSLFISRGTLYACGDNSNGQLGTMLNKKFTAQPTCVQLDGEKECRVKLIQAKKYSLALTDSGDMYVWGVRTNFGLPKLVKSEEKYEVEVIDIRVSSESIYGLAAEGTLYSWGVKGGEVKGGSFTCKKEKVVANGRAVLDFSSGDNYLLVLGDIVKQIPYSSVPPSLLTCYDEIQPPAQHLRHASNVSENFPSERESIESRLMQQSKGKSSNIQSKFSDLQLADSSMRHFDQRIDFSRNFAKMKTNYQNNHASIQDSNPSVLSQRKDFNNLKSNSNTIREKVKESTMEKRIQGQNDIRTTQNQVQMRVQQGDDSDNLEMVKTPSSSILCEPSNFLKESTRKENYEIRKASIYESGFDQQSPNEPMTKPNWKKKKYSYSYLQEKQNIPQKTRKEGKTKGKGQKSFERIMEMIEKSNHIGSRDSRGELHLNEEQWQNESEVVKSNRILRVQLRDKELKISQLQELLSRKEMEIQAQREIIKALRQKNTSNYASEQQ